MHPEQVFLDGMEPKPVDIEQIARDIAKAAAAHSRYGLEEVVQTPTQRHMENTGGGSRTRFITFGLAGVNECRRILGKDKNPSS
jgi:sugar (pentulose or hexulose) kinase